MTMRMIIPADVDLRNIEDRRRIAKAMKADPDVLFPIRLRITDGSHLECDTVAEAREMLKLLLADDVPQPQTTPAKETL